jgi:hypothetical protein
VKNIVCRLEGTQSMSETSCNILSREMYALITKFIGFVKQEPIALLIKKGEFYVSSI